MHVKLFISRINKNNETILRAVIVFQKGSKRNLDEVKEILSKKLKKKLDCTMYQIRGDFIKYSDLNVL